LPGLSKTSGLGDSPTRSFHVAFAQDFDLCPVQCLKSYEYRTRNSRPLDGQQPNPLFLSYIQPYKPVSSASLARWIKSLLKLAGIDTGIFSAHFLKGAATSAAFNRGVLFRKF
jgi:site-specific recombinase XerD